MLETLDYTIRIGSTPTFYISICISTLPTQHTTFIQDIHVYMINYSMLATCFYDECFTRASWQSVEYFSFIIHVN